MLDGALLDELPDRFKQYVEGYKPESSPEPGIVSTASTVQPDVPSSNTVPAGVAGSKDPNDKLGPAPEDRLQDSFSR